MTRHRLTLRTSFAPSAPGQSKRSSFGLAGGLALTALAGLASGFLLALALQTVMLTGRVEQRWLWTGHLRVSARLISTFVTASLPAARVEQQALGVFPLTPHPMAEHNARSEQVMSDQQITRIPVAQNVLDPNWLPATNLSSSPGYSSHPVVLAGNNGVVHVLWQEDGRIMHAVRQNGQWLPPVEVARGGEPAAVLGPDGEVHLVFAKEFFNQWNVFYTRYEHGQWSLPILVSKTSGNSTLPDLTVDDAGVLHAVWADEKTGLNSGRKEVAIYHGWLANTWLSREIPNARGSAPVITFDPQRKVLHVAWQSRGVGDGPWEVFHLQGITYEWSLPENISMSPDSESMNVSMVSDPMGITHVLWQEHTDRGVEIRYAYGGLGNWSPPEPVSNPDADAFKPAAQVTQQNQLSAVWQEGTVIAYRRKAGESNSWRPSSALVANAQGVGDVALAGDPAGNLHMAWSAWSAPGQRDVYYSGRGPLLTHKVYVPVAGIGY